MVSVTLSHPATTLLLIIASLMMASTQASTAVTAGKHASHDQVSSRIRPFPLIPPKVVHQDKAIDTNDNTIALTGQDLKLLQANKVVQKKWFNGQRVVAIQDIKAPAKVVLQHILNYNSYSRHVPSMSRSEIYEHNKTVHDNNRVLETIKVHFKVGSMGFLCSLYTHVVCDTATNTVAWTLDYQQKSGFDDNVGYWHVEPHPDKPDHASRLYYSTELRISQRFPAWVTNYINKSASNDGPKWVKKASESEYTNLIE